MKRRALIAAVVVLGLTAALWTVSAGTCIWSGYYCEPPTTCGVFIVAYCYEAFVCPPGYILPDEHVGGEGWEDCGCCDGT